MRRSPAYVPDAGPGGASCAGPSERDRLENRGLGWLVLGFLFCPCHLPLTLALGAAVLSGTAAAVVLRGHPFLAGGLLTTLWLAATWRGVRLLRAASRCARAARSRPPLGPETQSTHLEVP
jgi:hypothetical protein